jgi:carboxypeptidase C (cathepsin A)
VIFVFNGGPITPSLYLHIGAFGPERLAIPDDLSADPASFKTVDNPYTVLDVADLVFIDPAGTGFSRAAPGKPLGDYFSVVADGQEVSAFIARWLADHHRLDSPKYLFGESYGTLRAAEVADQLAKQPQPINLDGVVLMGQALNIVEFSQRPGNIISYVVSLPTLAAIAWYHEKVDRRGRTFEAFLDETRQFAQTEYLTALFQGDRLDPATRRHIAVRLEALTGIPASYYLAHGLEITKERYRVELLKDRHQVLGAYDARYVGAPAANGEEADPSARIEPAMESAFLRYLRDDLGVTWDEPYLIKSPAKDLDDWGWGATTPFSDWPYMTLISDVMNRNPRFRVMIGVGYYDTATTTGASEYALAQSGWPRDRASIAYFQGGHMAYTNEAALKALTDDVRAFVSARPTDAAKR